mgnify:CR=1 FL=1
MYKIHFLNVGHGDCIIVHYPSRTRKKDNYHKDERIMMIDINHHSDSDIYEDVIKYYKRNFKNGNGGYKSIFRFICTHPHKDHITGLKDLFEENGISVCNFWNIDHEFKPEKFEDDKHEQDWLKYKDLQKEGASSKLIITDREDVPRKYWDDDEDRITVISPSREIIKEVHARKQDGSKRESHEIEIDEISYSFLLRFNDIKVYLAGDGKEKCLNNIYENSSNELKGLNILKAGHHGQESGFHENLVKLMKPTHIIFSNSEDEDKAHGAEKLYSKVLPNAKILKTFEEGTIILNVDFDNNFQFINTQGNEI